jgi:hypothetical protein
MDWTNNKSETQAKNLKEIVEFATSLIQVALAVIGGTIAILLGSSYRQFKPADIQLFWP